MTPELVIYIGREAVYTVLLISGPLLIGSILIGLTISIFQATTQIQEQTLTFVPKIVAIFVMIVVLGPWMLNILIAFTQNLFTIMTRLGS
ncbi:MAG: flagellar biosynthesis protein FliQ [Eubacteriales bacterium]|jgi:flagellar biosynthetic protein FliQ|nr:flagellar biosynthesis protein FliQ [Eubacteriales bacterium]NCC80691.1 flagellar biosynthetic protein FliQ [Clostridia bacterium]